MVRYTQIVSRVTPSEKTTGFGRPVELMRALGVMALAMLSTLSLLALKGQAQVQPASGMTQAWHVAPMSANHFANSPDTLQESSCGCQSCSMRATHPDPLCVPAPEQMVGVTSGACSSCFRGIDCATTGGTEQRWNDVGPLNLNPLRHGEYIGPVRLPSMLDYRIRVGDQLGFIYILSREQVSQEYRLMVGDEIAVESVTDAEVKRGDLIQGLKVLDDGTVVLRLIGPIAAAGKTISQLRKDAEKAYATYLKNPSIDITPVKTNARLEALRQAVANPLSNTGAQQIAIRVTPDGKVQLPMIGSVYIVGMTMEEVRREVNLRYRERVIGIELEPSLVQQAPHFVYVFGNVTRPGRFEITQPTTVTQALAMAEGIQRGGNNRQIVVFRRAEDWRLVATMLDLRGAHMGKRPNPADEIWLRDNDLIIVPPKPVQVFNDFVRQVFSEGLYQLVPPGLTISSSGDVSLLGNFGTN